jgi:hypothetical protein
VHPGDGGWGAIFDLQGYKVLGRCSRPHRRGRFSRARRPTSRFAERRRPRPLRWEPGPRSSSTCRQRKACTSTRPARRIARWGLSGTRRATTGSAVSPHRFRSNGRCV